MMASTLKIIDDIDMLRAELMLRRRAEQRIAFVPTMGNLHAGHVSLVEQAQQIADCVVVSIFVNPMQFGEGEDFDIYPRTLEEDFVRLRNTGADLVFVPSVKAVYPQGCAQQTVVSEPNLSVQLCGAHRPGHFDGVCTIVSKLFNWVQPNVAVFGEKDFQQVQVIQRMVRDLGFPIEIITAPTKRESDGLAMSSRNQNLSSDARMLAPNLYQQLKRVSEQLAQNHSNFDALIAESKSMLQKVGFDVEYFEICDARTLFPAEPTTPASECVVLVAVHLDGVRLIDNIRGTTCSG